MKKFLSAFFVLFIIFSFAARFVSAQEVTPSQAPTPTPIDYQLPYPGILPDAPLYFLKTLRDEVMSILISNALKKADFDLLQSDKDLQAVVYLSQKEHKSEMVVKTLQKSDDEFSQAIAKTKQAKQQGMYIGDFMAKITIASLKHQEVVSDLLTGAQGEEKKQLTTSLENLKKFQKDLKNLQPK